MDLPLNDVAMKSVALSTYSGSYNDRLFKYFEDNSLTGNLSDKIAKAQVIVGIGNSILTLGGSSSPVTTYLVYALPYPVLVTI